MAFCPLSCLQMTFWRGKSQREKSFFSIARQEKPGVINGETSAAFCQAAWGSAAPMDAAQLLSCYAFFFSLQSKADETQGFASCQTAKVLLLQLLEKSLFKEKAIGQPLKLLNTSKTSICPEPRVCCGFLTGMASSFHF